jgi:hypothetical protein
LDEWKRFKSDCDALGFLLFADESVSTSNDVPKLEVINLLSVCIAFDCFFLFHSRLFMESM